MADTSEIIAEYAFGNWMIASKYVYYFQNKDELIKQAQDDIKDLVDKNN